MSSGKRPIGAAKGKQSDTEALCQPPPPRVDPNLGGRRVRRSAAGLPGGGGGVGTRPWWLALFACGGANWPLTLEPSAMTSRHPYYCGHPHCRGHPPAWVGIQNATSAHGVLP